MSKSKSQWDFGELFPAEATRKVLSVSELTGQIRALLEKQIGQIWVGGEITNLRAQSSGHIYFTLKEPAAQLNCVLFSREKVSHRELLADGQKVLLQGDVTVYEARGQYQLIVRAVELQGVGALQIAFEKLKQKLAAEGLFAPERKRPLPEYPAAHRPCDFADRRGHPRRAARRSAAQSGAGNHPRSLPRPRRRRGGGNSGRRSGCSMNSA